MWASGRAFGDNGYTCNFLSGGLAPPVSDRYLAVLFRYALAVAATAVATYLALLLLVVVPGQPTFAIFYGVVALSAWYGGLGPGLLATALSGMAIDYYFEDPRHTFGVASLPSGLRLAAFVVVALLIGGLQARVRATAERARRGELAAGQLAAIVTSSDDAIIGLDLDGTITSWNRGARDLLGYEPAEIVGGSIVKLAAEPERAEIPGLLRQLGEGGRFGHYDAVWIDRDGRQVGVSVALSPVRDADGLVVGASAIARDVTRRKLAEEAYARLAAVVAASAEGIVGADAEGRIVSWNEGARRLYGYHAYELLGRPLAELAPPDQLRRCEEVLDRVRAGEEAIRCTMPQLRRDGARVEMAMVLSPIRGASGAAVGVSMTVRPALGDASARWLALAAAARSVAREPDLAARRRALLAETVRASGADAAALLSWDVERGVLRATDRGDERWIGLDEAGAAGRAVTSREPVVVNDYPSDPLAAPVAVAAGVQAAVAAPVLVAGEVRGVLTATSRRADHRFTADDGAVLEALASLAVGCL